MRAPVHTIAAESLTREPSATVVCLTDRRDHRRGLDGLRGRGDLACAERHVCRRRASPDADGELLRVHAKRAVDLRTSEVHLSK